MRLLAAALACLALAVAVTWPVSARLGAAVPGTRVEGDVALNLWALSWIYHQVPASPRDLLDANAFHPARSSLALSDLLFGEALLGLPAALVAGPEAAYGLAFLLAAWGSALGMALLVQRLVGDAWASAFAAAALVTLPYFAAHVNHLQLQFVGCFPLLLAALLAFSERPSAGAAAGAGLAVGAGALFSAYYAVLLVLEAAVVLPVLALLRPRLRSRAALARLGLGAAVAALVAAPALLPHAWLGHARSVHMTYKSSARPADYLAWTAPPAARVSEERRIALPVTTAVLALAGLAGAWRRPELRAAVAALAAVGALAFVLSGGPTGVLGAGYSRLMRLPGLSGIRAPARFSILVAMAAVALAAIALHMIRARLRSPLAGHAAVALLVTLVLAEKARPGVAVVAVPAPGAEEDFLAGASRPGAVVHLPAVSVAGEVNSLYMLASRHHFRPLVNGYSGERPPRYHTIVNTLAELPAPRALHLAADLDLAFVVLHQRPESREGAGLGSGAEGGAPLAEVFSAPGVRVFELAEPARLRAWLAARAVVAAAAPASAPPVSAPPPAPAVDGMPPFGAGERLDYVARWLGLEAARGSLSISAGAARGTLRFRAEAETTAAARAFYDARFLLEAECDARTLLPIRARRETREGARREVEEVIFDRQRRVIETGGLELPLEPDAHDPFSVVYAIRASRFGAVGSTTSFSLNDLGNPLDLEVTVAGREAGVVDLRLVSRERNVRERVMEFQLRLEESGARRILEMGASTRAGEVLLTLVP